MPQPIHREANRTRTLVTALGMLASVAVGAGCVREPMMASPLEEGRGRAWPESTTPLPKPIVRTSLTPEMRALTFGFYGPTRNPAEERAVELLKNALSKRGYHLVSAEDPRTDARMEVAFTRISSLRADSSGDLQASITVAHESDVMSWLIAKIPANDAAAVLEADDVADRITEAPNLQGFARARARQRSSSERLSSGKQPGPSTVASGPSDAPLSEAALRRCRNARSIEECGKVRAYVERFPEGEAAMKARAALDLAMTRFDRQKTSSVSDSQAATVPEPIDELPIGAP